MSSIPTHEKHSIRILDALESDGRISQRSLASELGIALGLTNLLVRGLVRKGWVRVTGIKRNRVRYFVTPAGIAEKARMSRVYFENSVQFYRQTRNRIQQEFLGLPASLHDDGLTGQPLRIVFYGAGEVAEIGYVCLVETGLELVGVVEAARTKPFFGLDVSDPEDLDGLFLGGRAFDCLVVMSFVHDDKLRGDIEARRVPMDRVFWL